MAPPRARTLPSTRTAPPVPGVAKRCRPAPQSSVGMPGVDAAKPAERLYRVWDADLKGFGVRVTPAGVKSYIVAYRPNGGGRSVSQQEFTIARHGVLTPDEAREEAAKILATVRQGGDPQAARSAARKELTVSELCDLYLAEGLR